MYKLWKDGETEIFIDPEFDFAMEGKMLREGHIARSGARYSYSFGEVQRFKFGVRYVDSSFAAKVNSAWANNTDMYFSQDSASTAYLVRIVNRRKPISEYIQPYRDQFKGSLELETYRSDRLSCELYTLPMGDWGYVSSASIGSYDLGSVATAATNCPIDFGGLI